jgi:hypothetical protein
VSRPPPVEGLSEVACDIAGGPDESGLIAQRLSAQGDGVSAGTKIAHELTVGEPAQAREVAAGNRPDGIIVRTRPFPRDDSIPRRDHVREDPRAGRPGRRESESLETIGVGGHGAVRIACLRVPVPGDPGPIFPRSVRGGAARQRMRISREEPRKPAVCKARIPTTITTTTLAIDVTLPSR